MQTSSYYIFHKFTDPQLELEFQIYSCKNAKNGIYRVTYLLFLSALVATINVFILYLMGKATVNNILFRGMITLLAFLFSKFIYTKFWQPWHIFLFYFLYPISARGFMNNIDQLFDLVIVYLACTFIFPFLVVPFVRGVWIHFVFYFLV